MVNLLEDPVLEEETSIQDEAVRWAQRVEDLKLELEIATARRDEFAEKCAKAGLETYCGYRFVIKRPSDTMSEVKFAELHGDLLDQFIEWTKERTEVKVTKKGVTDFLKAIGHEKPSAVLADITVPGKGNPTYGMQRVRE